MNAFSFFKPVRIFGLFVPICIVSLGAQALEADDPGWKLMGKQGQNGWTATWYISDVKPVPNSSNIAYSVKGMPDAKDNFRYRISEAALNCKNRTIITLTEKTYMKDGSVQTWDKGKWEPIIPELKAEAAYDLFCKPDKPLRRANRWTKIADNVYIDLNTRGRDSGNFAAWYKMDYFSNKDGKKTLLAYVSTFADERALVAASMVVEHYTDGRTQFYNINDFGAFDDQTMPTDSKYVVEAAKKYVVKEQAKWPGSR